MKSRFVSLLLALLVAAPLFADTKSTASLEERRKALNDLLNEQWEYTLKKEPIFASIIGDKRYNDQVSDESLDAINRDYEMSGKFLARFEAIDTTGFPEQEALNQELMVRGLKDDLDNRKFEFYLMPVNQMGGIHIQAPGIVSLLSFQTVKDYDDYIARLKALPTMFDQTMDRMRLGAEKHLMPPKFLLEKVADQARGIASQKPEESPFVQPLANMPKDFSEPDQKRLREAMIAVVRDQIAPAYNKFADYVEKDYAPKGRTEVGVWALPGGAARYGSLVKLFTTTDMTPEEIHQLGLREVDSD